MGNRTSSLFIFPFFSRSISDQYFLKVYFFHQIFQHMQTFLNKLGESNYQIPSVHFHSSYSFESCFEISLQTCFLIILFHLPPTFAISSPSLSTQKYFLTRKVHKQQKYKNTKAQKYKTVQAAEIRDVWLCFNRGKQQVIIFIGLKCWSHFAKGNLLYNLNSLQAAPASQPTGRLQIECAQNTNKRTQLPNHWKHTKTQNNHSDHQACK